MGVVHSKIGMITVMMVMVSSHPTVVAAFNCAAINNNECRCVGGINGRGGQVSNVNDWWRTAAAVRLSSVSSKAIRNGDYEDEDDDDDDVVLDENWSNRFKSPATPPFDSTETPQLSDASASAAVVTELGGGAAAAAAEGGRGGEEDEDRNHHPLIESWLQSYIPTLSPSESQTYATILANDGFTTLESLNSINSKASGRVEDLYFMKKDHRRRLMVELGVMRSRRSRTVGVALTGRKTSRLANITNKESSQEQPPLDESISIWLAEQSRLVDERAREETATTTTTTTTETQPRETIGHSPTRDSMNDISETQYKWEREGKGTIQDDLSARFSSLDNRMTEGSAQNQMRRLRELREAFQRSESASMQAIMEDESILDDLTARYSSLEIKPLDDGSAEKENRRLRELREAFKRKVENVESNDSSSSKYCASTPDDFVMRYDSLDTTVVLDKVGSAKKEARRLAELKEMYLARKTMFSTETENIEDIEPLRLDLLKRPATEETSIERKERMRLKEIQRLARLAAEKKVERVVRRSSRLQRQDLKQGAKERYSLLDSITRSDAFTAKRYKTKEERRLETLQLNFAKKKRSDTEKNLAINATATMRSQTPPNERGRIPSSDAATRTARQESILAEMKVILAEMDQRTKAHGQFSFQRASNQKKERISADQQGYECEVDDEECWDITRSPKFYPREAQSLATTLPPIKMQMQIPDTNIVSRQEAVREAANSISTTEVLNQADPKVVQHVILPQEFERESASTTLLQAAQTHHRDLDSSDSKSTTMLSCQGFAEEVAFSLEGESKSPPVPSIQPTAEDFSRVNSKDLKLERVEETAILTDKSSLESIGIGPRISTDNRVEATEQHTKRSTLYQQIKSNREENREPHDFKSTSDHPLATTQIQTHDVLLDVSSRFPETRPFMAVHTRQQKRRFNERVNANTQAIQNIAKSFSKDRTSFLAFPPRKDLKSASRSKDLSYSSSPGTLSPKRLHSTDASQVTTSSQFLDKPRPFQPNLDMVSSNTSGSRFKRTSDLYPEEKKMQRDFFDICTRPMPSVNEMAMTKISRVLEVAPATSNTLEEGVRDITRAPLFRYERSDSIVGGAIMNAHLMNLSEANMNPAHINSDGSNQSGDEEVMDWLLTHLPDLQEDNAISYFGSLLNDGFDCKESLGEILAEDLQFMTIEHQQALTQSLHRQTKSRLKEQE